MSETKKETEVNSKSEMKYAILQENNGEENESWLYFLRYNGNEDELKFLKQQLDSIDWYFLDDMSVFDLDLDHLVSETTAREMSRVELNTYTMHRKFDGKLKKIDLDFTKSTSNNKKLKRVYRKLAFGNIDQYIDQEDRDPDDIVVSGESSSSSSSDNDDEHNSDSSSSSSSSNNNETATEAETKPRKRGSVPKNIEIPRYAKAKKKHR
jgi:hypothetical protein